MILVTGAAGFIGSHVVEQLLKLGFKVAGIDNFDPFYDKEIKWNNLSNALKEERFSFWEGDITDVNFLDHLPFFPSAIIHLAAKAGVQPSLKDPKGYMDANVQGTLNLLEWMRKRGCSKLIFASSSSVYGNNQVPFSEEDNDIYPLSPYAQTKRSGELMNYTYHHLYNFDIINLRFFTVFGPRQRPDLAIHKFTDRIVHDQPIDVYGKGNTMRDYTFIGDIVQGVINAYYYLVAHRDVFEIINLGNRAPVSLAELIETLEDTIGKKAIRNYMPEQPGDMKVTCASVDKASRLLSYTPKTTLKEGIRIFYDWYRNQQNENEQIKYRCTYL